MGLRFWGFYGFSCFDFCYGVIFQDKSFTFILKTPPASVLLLKAAGILAYDSMDQLMFQGCCV